MAADSFASRLDRQCDDCREHPPDFARVIAYGEYTGELRELVHLLKFERVRPAAAMLARLLGEVLERERESILQPILVTAVPLFAAKERARGFNQSRLLAQELAIRLRKQGWQVRENYGLLSRTRETRSQSELNYAQRRANLRGVFSAGANAAAAKGATVLLVDDIVTTGTTARQCARTLKKLGAREIVVAAAARSQRNDVTAWGGVQ